MCSSRNDLMIEVDTYIYIYMAHDDVALYRLAEVCFMFSHRFSKTGLPQQNCLLLVRLRYITYPAYASYS